MESPIDERWNRMKYAIRLNAMKSCAPSLMRLTGMERMVSRMGTRQCTPTRKWCKGCGGLRRVILRDMIRSDAREAANGERRNLQTVRHRAGGAHRTRCSTRPGVLSRHARP